MGAWARYLFERLVGKRGPFMSGRWVGAVPLRAVDEWARSLYERWVGGRGPIQAIGGWMGWSLFYCFDRSNFSPILKLLFNKQLNALCSLRQFWDYV